VHPRYKTPWINTLIVGVLVSLAAAFFDINALGDLTSVGTLFAFGLVCFSVIFLRYKRPDLPRPFRVPLFPLLPIVGVAICFWLAWDGATIEIRWWFFWFLVGAVALYFAYAFWASPMREKQKAAG
jgi:APA family basic amino acid/polyamine antiporter